MAGISESDIGKRVTIRLHDGTGYRDLVGELESTQTIRNRHGQLVEFDPNEIYLWREIIPVPRTATSGAPLSIRINELEQLASESWKAEVEAELGGWLLRADVGHTKRANSALAINGNISDVEIDQMIGWYRERNLKPTVSLVPEIHQVLDERLSARGFKHLLDLAVMVKDGKVNDLPTNIEVSDTPSAAWLKIHNDEAIQTLLTRTPAKYLTLTENDEVVAIGRVGFVKDWAVLSRIWVAPNWRGKGYGRIILNALESIAGDRKLALQVSIDNLTAINLYSAAGYQIHHIGRFRELSQQIDLSQDCQC